MNDLPIPTELIPATAVLLVSTVVALLVRLKCIFNTGPEEPTADVHNRRDEDGL